MKIIDKDRLQPTARSHGYGQYALELALLGRAQTLLGIIFLTGRDFVDHGRGQRTLMFASPSGESFVSVAMERKWWRPFRATASYTVFRGDEELARVVGRFLP